MTNFHEVYVRKTDLEVSSLFTNDFDSVKQFMTAHNILKQLTTVYSNCLQKFEYTYNGLMHLQYFAHVGFISKYSSLNLLKPFKNFSKFDYFLSQSTCLAFFKNIVYFQIFLKINFSEKFQTQLFWKDAVGIL